MTTRTRHGVGVRFLPLMGRSWVRMHLRRLIQGTMPLLLNKILRESPAPSQETLPTLPTPVGSLPSINKAHTLAVAVVEDQAQMAFHVCTCVLLLRVTESMVLRRPMSCQTGGTPRLGASNIPKKKQSGAPTFKLWRILAQLEPEEMICMHCALLMLLPRKVAVRKKQQESRDQSKCHWIRRRVRKGRRCHFWTGQRWFWKYGTFGEK